MNEPSLPRLSIVFEGDDEELERLKGKIQRERGFNCEFYKDKCLRRRIAVRMRARGQGSFAEYGALLDRDPTEYDVLLDALTINVTKFFRNIETWKVVEDLVLPELFKGTGERRIWSAGSSSGEEAYTLSILLREWAARNGSARALDRFRVFGTDIDRRSLDAARAGEYPELSMTETPAQVKERWFSPGPPFRIVEEARQNVSFFRKDLISDPLEKNVDLIFCRNVVIYFDRDLQERLFQGFYDSLVPGGFLVLGKVETLLGKTRTLFRPVNNRERVYQKPA